MANNKGYFEFSDGHAWEQVERHSVLRLLDEGVEVYGINLVEETEHLIEDLDDYEAFEIFAIEV